MRLATSTLIAVVLHAVLFGAAAAVLAGSSSPTNSVPVTVPVEVEVIAARPDPVRDTPLKVPVPSGITEPRPRQLQRHSERLPPPRRVLALAPDPSVTDRPAAPVTPSPPEQPTGAIAWPSPAVAAPVQVESRRGAASPSASADVSAVPRYRTNPKPDYPIPCQRRREEGIVYLNVLVKPDGIPGSISLSRSSGHPLLDRAALEAVRRWTFEPGRAAGVPVSSPVVVPIRFFLSEQP